MAEPYAIAAKFPSAFVQVHYARGCSLAEAFYQSISGPYQYLIVGDPLCRPWARIPRVTALKLPPDPDKPHLVKIRPGVEDPARAPAWRYELFIDGRRGAVVRPGQVFTVDTGPLAIGHHEARVVAVGPPPIQTRGFCKLPFLVERRGLRLRVFPVPAAKSPWNKPVVLNAELPGARGIVFFLHSLAIARIEGPKGTVRINPMELGQGPVRIRPVGLIENGKKSFAVRGKPIEVTIVPPPALPPLDPPDSARLAKGLKLSIRGAPPVAVLSTARRNWLKEAGAKRDDLFFLQGLFKAPEDDVYVFQVRSDAGLSLLVDDCHLGEVDKPGLKALPAPLQRGWHRLVAFGVCGKAGLLDLRFGGKGLRRVGAERFSHVRAKRPLK